MRAEAPDVTGLLRAWSAGDDGALRQLIPLVHDELHRIAVNCLFGDRARHSLQATALVNETFLRLVDVRRIDWQNRVHFLAMAARLMRRVLVDLARERGAEKRGAGLIRVTFDEALLEARQTGEDVLRLDEALSALAEFDPRKTHVVELRFFGGLTVDETAVVLKTSSKTIQRDWEFAKAWLQKYMSAA